MEKLDKVAELKTKLKGLEHSREVSYAFWSLWKYYAQSKEWFNEFLYGYDLRIPWDELKFRSNKVDGADVIEVSLDYGVRLWNKRLNILESIEETTKELHGLLFELIYVDGLTFAEVAKPYGATPGGLHHYMARNGLIGEKAG